MWSPYSISCIFSHHIKHRSVPIACYMVISLMKNLI